MHEEYMRRAIALSREKMREDEGGPFAAIVVRDGAIVGEGWNQVTGHNDPTAHAEIVAIREACRTLGTFSLEGCVIYTSCEPCPMCLSAIHWAHIDSVFYANTADDAAAIGFDDARLYHELALSPDERTLPMARLLAGEAIEVFREWAADPDRVPY
ncbi:MAG: nucleoside deaminase [Coriobacteriia bacterium]|nr:nucleoside deaminase [Coriobacteriia bacterium]